MLFSHWSSQASAHGSWQHSLACSGGHIAGQYSVPGTAPSTAPSAPESVPESSRCELGAASLEHAAATIPQETHRTVRVIQCPRTVEAYPRWSDAASEARRCVPPTPNLCRVSSAAAEPALPNAPAAELARTRDAIGAGNVAIVGTRLHRGLHAVDAASAHPSARTSLAFDFVALAVRTSGPALLAVDQRGIDGGRRALDRGSTGSAGVVVTAGKGGEEHEGERERVAHETELTGKPGPELRPRAGVG